MATGSDQHVEETLQYFIFPVLYDNSSVVVQLEQLRVECFSFLSELSSSYIWHDQGINLLPITDSAQGKAISRTLFFTFQQIASGCLHDDGSILPIVKTFSDLDRIDNNTGRISSQNPIDC